MITATLTEIKREAGDLLDGADVTVTADPAEAASTISYGGTALLIMPPRIEWATATRRTATWTLWAITGESHDPSIALGVLEAVLDALAPLMPDTAQPQTYEVSDRAAFPGYEITLTTEHN